MKNLWKKLPAWLKAILLNIVLLFPVVIINQLFIQTNFVVSPEFGWALIPCLGTLAIYWWLVRKWNPFNRDSDIALSFGSSIKQSSLWATIIGIMMFTYAIMNLGEMFTPEGASAQLEFISSINNLEPLAAIPLLLALSINAGIVEEVTYRGYIQNTLNRAYARWIVYGLIAIIFAAMHFLPWQLVVPYMLVSIAFSIGADKHKSVGGLIIAHALFDFLLLTNIYFDGLQLSDPTAANILINIILVLISARLIFYKSKQQKLVPTPH